MSFETGTKNKKIFNINMYIDFSILMKIFSNLEHPNMINYKKNLSTFLYNKEIKFYASILENPGEEYPVCKSEFLEDLLDDIYQKDPWELVKK